MRLTDLFPHAVHVESLGLGIASDKTVWEFARTHDYIIVSKDVDFSEMGLLYGFPPKVIWIRRGNCSTDGIENLLRANRDNIHLFRKDKGTGILTLW